MPLNQRGCRTFRTLPERTLQRKLANPCQSKTPTILFPLFFPRQTRMTGAIVAITPSTGCPGRHAPKLSVDKRSNLNNSIARNQRLSCIARVLGCCKKPRPCAGNFRHFLRLGALIWQGLRRS